MAWEWIAETADEMRWMAGVLGELMEAGDCLALYGGLGVGKTTFTQGLAQGLGVRQSVNSPTFTIVKEYQGRLPLYHMDLYRLDGAFEELGLEEYWDGDGVSVIEWPEAAKEWLPADRLELRFAQERQGHRVVQVTATGSSSERRLVDWQTRAERKGKGGSVR